MRLICSLAALLISTVFVAAAEAQELFLVSASYGNNVIALCERDGSVIWKFKTGGPKRGHAGHHEIQMLENGNILFHDDWDTVKHRTQTLSRMYKDGELTDQDIHGNLVDASGVVKNVTRDDMVIG